MSVKVKFKDTGVSTLAITLRDLRIRSVTIGFQGPSGEQLYPVGISVAQVALWQEFGTEDIPARSFLRKTLFAHRSVIASMSAREISRAVRGEQTTEDALQAIGQFAADKVADAILRGNFKALAPSTVVKKGHARPLIDSQLLLRSVSWAIRKNDQIVKQGLAT